MGDLLDRGDHELALLFWLERLQRQAAAAGGAIHVLNGESGPRAVWKDVAVASDMAVDAPQRAAGKGCAAVMRSFLQHPPSLAFPLLAGNHETMNVAGQYRYVTRGAMHR